MTDKGKQQLKNIIIQALSEFFEQSGINKILLSLYQNKRSNPVISQKPTKKISNILEKNSKISQLRKSELVNYNEDDDIKLPTVGVQGAKINPDLRVSLNENIDPLETGQSILDHVNSLPDFLTRGLAKIKNNATN